MVISVALFGVTASGIAVNLLEKHLTRLAPDRTALLHNCALLFSLSVLLAFFGVRALPMDYFRISIEWRQIIFLVLSFLFLALPFFFSGLASALAYSVLPGKSGRIYFSSMTGSALGCILPIGLIPLIGLRNSILAAAFLPALAIFAIALANKRQWAPPVLVATITAVLFFLPQVGLIKPSPYKLLPQYKLFPDADIKETVDHVTGRYTHISSPFIRFAPGLSLKYSDVPPRQEAIIRDGDDQLVLYDPKVDLADSFVPYTLSYTGYYLLPRIESALVIQRGGGLALACAMAKNIGNIQLIEQHPFLARTVEAHYDRKGLAVANQNPRVYLARSHKAFDVIHIENWGSSLPGMESLHQQHLYTLEAFDSYLSHLSDRGVLIVSRRILMPPADSARLLATARRVLSELHRSNPSNTPEAYWHTIILRTWDSFVLIIGKSRFEKDTLTRLRRFSKMRNFDLVFYPGIQNDELNRYNVLERPFYNEAATALLGDNSKDFVAAYPINVHPQTDDAPYPSYFLRWSKIAKFVRSSGNSLYALVLTGEMVTVILFAAALVISFCLLFLPNILTAGRKTTAVPYFICLGAGFMFVEMGFLKTYTFLVGDPVVSFSFVLAALLFFSGVGGMVSDQLGLRSLKIILLGITLTASASMIALPHITRLLLPLPAVVRIALALLWMAPLGFMLGFPFPSAVRIMLATAGERAFAWAANGSASVLTAIVALPVAMNLGISRLFLAGGLLYLLAMAVMLYEGCKKG